MFERITDDVRRVLVAAQDEAARLGHGWVGTEHLLLGLLAVDRGVAADVLGRAGLGAGDVRDDIVRRVGAHRTGPGSHADALRAIGIDLDAVRQQVERSFGPGALDRPARRRRRGWRRRACSSATGAAPFSPRAKKVLELSLREALALRDDAIHGGHLLLGLLREGSGLAARVLVDRGLRPDDLRQQVLRALGRVA